MARGVRGGSKTARESQRKSRERKQRKKLATELAKLQEGGEHRTGTFRQFKHDKDSAVHKQRVKYLKSQLNIPDKPLTIKDHLGRDSSVGAANRAKVRGTPDKEGKPGKSNVSDETLKTVRDTLAKEKNKNKESRQAGGSTPKESNRDKASIPKGNTDTSKKERPRSTVFTRHYKTGKTLGVMTRAQRRKYEKEAGYDTDKPKTFEGEVAKHEKESGHGQKHKRETLYKSAAKKRKPSQKSAKPAQTRADTINQRSKQIENAQNNQKKKSTTNGNGTPKTPTTTTDKSKKSTTNGQPQKPKTNKEAGTIINGNVTNGQKKKKKINRVTGEGLTPRKPPELNRGDDPNAGIGAKGGGTRHRGGDRSRSRRKRRT